MEPFLIVVCVVAIVAIGAFIVLRKGKKETSSGMEESTALSTGRKNYLSKQRAHEMTVTFDNLPALTETEETRLVEVKDEKLLARIDSAVPGTIRTMASTLAAVENAKVPKTTGPLYQVIIPKGKTLDNSSSMKGAFKATFRGTNGKGYGGSANLIKVDNDKVNEVASLNSKMNVMNAVMGVASMVVSQYYMTQINNKLEEISSGIEKIADFQKNEFKSKVYALAAEVNKSSRFQVETMESNELRNRELQHLRTLEHECAQLLGQANLSLQDIAGKMDADYDEYEKLIGEAEIWFQYQQALLEIMSKISDLTYALNLGAISRENSFALLLPYVQQSKSSIQKLGDWHKANIEKLQISLDDGKRKRQGVEGVLMGVLGLFDDDMNYKQMSERTVSLISHQEEGRVFEAFAKDDLFREDVRLIAKDGKLFYLPSAEGRK